MFGNWYIKVITRYTCISKFQKILDFYVHTHTHTQSHVNVFNYSLAVLASASKGFEINLKLIWSNLLKRLETAQSAWSYWELNFDLFPVMSIRFTSSFFNLYLLKIMISGFLTNSLRYLIFKDLKMFIYILMWMHKVNLYPNRL